jgi:DnaK suppressor protein
MLDSPANDGRPDAGAEPRPSRLTKRQLEHFRDLLLERRAEIVGDVQAMEAGALRGGGNSEGHAPMHMADVGSDTFEQEFTLRLAATEREMLAEIDEALKRIEDGTYGICEVTGRPISLPRLEAKPWAKVCIEVARERDRYHGFRR